jgi:hypothetical protein
MGNKMLRLGGIVGDNESVRDSTSSLSIPSQRERKLMEEIQRQQLGRLCQRPFLMRPSLRASRATVR